MAPSVVETPEQTESAPIVVPVKAVPGSTDVKPRVRRAIDEEGGTTTATVSQSNCIWVIYQPLNDTRRLISIPVPPLPSHLGLWREISSS